MSTGSAPNALKLNPTCEGCSKALYCAVLFFSLKGVCSVNVKLGHSLSPLQLPQDKVQKFRTDVSFPREVDRFG